MPLVTVAIPTRNRGDLLVRAVSSALAQTFRDFEVLVVDNASDEALAERLPVSVPREVRYVRNSQDLGMLENWNRCLALCRGELLLILGDDDVLGPRFLEASVERHMANPMLAFTYTHCTKVDAQARPIRRWGYEFAPPGLMTGKEYVLCSARYGCCLTNSSTVLMRVAAAREVGGFRAELATNTFDFNLWLRLALMHPVYFLAEDLVQYMVHDGQVSVRHWRDPGLTGPIGTQLELTAALARLLEGGGVSDPAEVGRLLQQANGRLAELLRRALPAL